MNELDRNNQETYLGKYALIRLDKLRKLSGLTEKHILQLIIEIEDILYSSINESKADHVQFIEVSTKLDTDEFFVIKLKDENAFDALLSYSDSAFSNGNYKLSDEVRTLAFRSGIYHPNCKNPD